MEKKRIKKNLGILLAGVLYAFKGAAAFALLAGSVACMFCVQIESGYLAVGKFVGGIIVAGVALGLFYWCGRDFMKDVSN